MNISNGDLIEFHRFLIADQGRTEGFRKAIAQAVRPGDVVVYIGAGTGILSFFACQAGARKVYAIEANPSIELAEVLCKQNGFQDRVVFLHDLSFNVSLPELADVVVSDTGATFGLQGGQLGAILDARKRMLREGAKVIPNILELSIAPVEIPELHDRLTFWRRDVYDLDLSPIRAFAMSNFLSARYHIGNLLSLPTSLARIQFSEGDTTYVKATTSCVATRAGVMHGIGGWSSYELAPGISFSNSPINPTARWVHCFFPIDTPTALNEGDRVDVTISTRNGSSWRWRIKVIPKLGANAPEVAEKQFDHADFFGFPFTKPRLDDQSHPRLSRRGQAEMFILGLFDGQRTVAELTRELLSGYNDCFPTAAAASAFLKEIVTRSS